MQSAGLQKSKFQPPTRYGQRFPQRVKEGMFVEGLPMCWAFLLEAEESRQALWGMDEGVPELREASSLYTGARQGAGPPLHSPEKLLE